VKHSGFLYKADDAFQDAHQSVKTMTDVCGYELHTMQTL